MGFFSEYKAVNKLLQQKQQIVFYTESRYYYQYFEKLISDLLKNNLEICYLTSDAKDPLLNNPPAKMKVIYVKWLLGFLFSKISAKVMVMTMPDLGNYLFKRSDGVDNYIYMFHAAVSTHQQYRKNAFDNYDTIFCTGSYQEAEIRKAEQLHGQKPKELISYGYPLIDQIKKEQESPATGNRTILIAPSWFKGCIFETCLEELIKELSGLPYNIILRSHPEYEKREKRKFNEIKRMISDYSNISIDTLPNILNRLPTTDILITDRSGIAFEFAFGTGKPVLFIDTALKQTNPDWKELDIEPIENKLRSQLGISIAPSELNRLAEKIKEIDLSEDFNKRIEVLEKEIFYNSEESYKKGVEYIKSKISNV